MGPQEITTLGSIGLTVGFERGFLRIKDGLQVQSKSMFGLSRKSAVSARPMSHFTTAHTQSGGDLSDIIDLI